MPVFGNKDHTDKGEANRAAEVEAQRLMALSPAELAGLVRMRGHVTTTFVLTAVFTYALLALAIIEHANQHVIIAARAVYIAGAVIGLFNRWNSESQTDSSVEDYGL